MGWKQVFQYRQQYNSQGHSEMAWQPTHVYEPEVARPRSSFSGPKANILDALSMLAVLAMTYAAYHYVGNTSFVAHFSSVTRGVLLGAVSLFTFIASFLLVDTRVFRFLIVAGMVFWPVAIFLLK